MKICLYGAAREQIDRSYINAAEKFGADLAKRGHTLVFGGGARGMMGAAARGAESGGADIVGIAPSGMNIDEEEYKGRMHRIYTKNLAERKARFIQLADAFVVMPGGIGTLDELFDLLSVKKLREWVNEETNNEQMNNIKRDDASGDQNSAGAPRQQEPTAAYKIQHLTAPSLIHNNDKPIAIYNINGYYDPLKQMMEKMISESFAGEWAQDMYKFCSTETELWHCLEGFPEECCDAAEISDSEYVHWENASKNGFWNTFLKNK